MKKKPKPALPQAVPSNIARRYGAGATRKAPTIRKGKK